MFYSHEILSNTQYGVATIWLVATVGNTTQKRVTRKAIQEVNVPKACETIIHPGAPLALRLQGNLLYGVSRVFAQQCRYVLSDAEKTQADMMTFFRVMQTNATDPRAGKVKRHHITLEDDPNFDPSNCLPNPNLLTSVDDLVLFSNQFNVSQLTPLTQTTASSGRDHSLLGFNLPQSSHSGGSYRLPTDLNRDSPFPKTFNPQGTLEEFNPFGGDDFEGLPGVYLNFDADGNLVGLGEPEPELPPLPGLGEIDLQLQDNVAGPGTEKGQVGDGNVVIMGEDALPDAEPFPKRRHAKDSTSSVVLTTESVETEEAQAPARRRRRRKLHRMVDHKDYIPSVEVRNWSVNYLTNMQANRKSFPITTLAQARKNAKALLFGNGIAGVGQMFAGAHPLVEDFSGMSLLARLQGKEPEQEEDPAPRGRRRVSAEAFEEEQADERRVRQKTDGGAKIGRGLDDNMGALILGDDMALAPEMGMEAVPALDDRHSSSMAPWSRPPSVAPGSSIRGHGSVQKKMPAPSPLLARGSVVRSIERWSDVPGLPFGSDDLAQLHSQNDSIGHEGLLDGLDLPAGNDTQKSTQGLDGSALDFLGYATVRAQAKGYTRPRDRVDRRWINFDTLTDELEDPTSTRKFVSEAFMHVLTLATKSALAVEQDGIAENRPFGTIRLGLALPEEDDEMADELA